MIQKTFVAEEGKDKKKARLSWYHPDDTVSTCPTLHQHQHVLLSVRVLCLVTADVLYPVHSCGIPVLSDVLSVLLEDEVFVCPALTMPDVHADGAKGLVQRGSAEGPGLLQAFQHLSTLAPHVPSIPTCDLYMKILRAQLLPHAA